MKVAAALAVSLVLLTACASEGSAPATTTTTRLFKDVVEGGPPVDRQTPEPTLQAYVQAYFGSYFEGDHEFAFDLLSWRCKQQTDAKAFQSEVESAVDEFGDVNVVGYSEKVNGDVATVSYELTNPSLNQTDERWVLEGDAWHKDDC